MGFAGGLPLLLTLTLLQAWLTAEDVGLTTIGLLGLVGLPYSIKFLWAPLLDRFKPLPLGRRRGWLVVTQTALAASIAVLGMQDPSANIWGIVVAATLIAFFSATQDIVIDAYRRESLADSEQGLGASYYTYGYRLGMLLASAGGLILADIIGFSAVYFLMAAIMLACVIVTLVAPEPEAESRPRSLSESFIGPFVEFFKRRNDATRALLVLVFIVIYKLGDNLANHMAIPFYLELGFSNTEVGSLAKIYGTGALLFGVFLGGAFTLKMGLYRSMFVIGVLQALSTACYVFLALAGYHLGWLAAVIGFENLTVGMGTAALLAFMASLTNRQFTATQFALLSTLATLPRSLLSAPSGFMAEQLGWPQFFIVCALLALPGLLLLPLVRQWFGDDEKSGAASAAGEASRSPVADAS
ncbi:MAG: AmpG family muropeptide MFS transporter [Gammaproteobacteria bacterium]|nr:AmpG family muropeptide MFS transporter [Gammaproteobacteria bacterium]